MAPGSLEEVADELLHIHRLVRRLAQAQAELETAVGDLRAELAQTGRGLATELAGLRRELLHDRRALAARGAFDAVHPALDQITLLRESWGEPPADAGRHLDAVAGALRSVLRGLGYFPFTVDVGATFDPFRMECLEYAQGQPGRVLAVLRPGYEADGLVVRPCGVVIADPRGVVAPAPGASRPAGQEPTAVSQFEE